MSSPLITPKVDSNIYTPSQSCTLQALFDKDARDEEEGRACVLSHDTYISGQLCTPQILFDEENKLCDYVPFIFTDEKFITDLMQELSPNTVCSPSIFPDK